MNEAKLLSILISLAALAVSLAAFMRSGRKEKLSRDHDLIRARGRVVIGIVDQKQALRAVMTRIEDNIHRVPDARLATRLESVVNNVNEVIKQLDDQARELQLLDLTVIADDAMTKHFAHLEMSTSVLLAQGRSLLADTEHMIAAIPDAGGQSQPRTV